MKLLTTSNPKLRKGEKKGFLTGGLHLAPASLSGRNVCPGSSPGCRAACLNTAGRGQFHTTQDARIRKTKLFFEDRQNFMSQLEKDILGLARKAKRENKKPVVRLNLTSDLLWEKFSFIGNDGKKHKNLMTRFPKIQFMDYTKIPTRKNIPKNYHLTFSLSENNDSRAKKAIKNKMNVAVVFRDSNLPKKYMGLRVVNGDDTDLRFKDKKNSIVGLKAKGKAKKDDSGFVKDA